MASSSAPPPINAAAAAAPAATIGTARSTGPSAQLGPLTLCAVCQSIDIPLLPSEDEPGQPHHHSLAALKVSANTCTLCAMLLSVALGTRDDIDRELNGQAKDSFRSFISVESPNGGTRMLESISGLYLAGSNMTTGRAPGEPEPSAEFTKRYTFQDDDKVRPWLFGNWWKIEPSVTPQLIGLGVRLGLLPTVEHGEGNTTGDDTVSPKGDESIHLRGTYLRLRTSVGSPFASWIPGRLVDMDSSSPASFGRINRWLAECDKFHKCKPQNTPLPTRILEVGSSDDDSVTLVDGAEILAPFLALSHRWGTSHRITLTKDNIISFKSGIALEALPKTFLDAVNIARALDVRYLWIDSLCIIQDDPDDWEREAARMADVYANAYLTIAASFSEDDSSGCFPPWSVRAKSDGVSTDIQSHGFPPIYAHASPLIDMKPRPNSEPGTASYLAKCQFTLLNYTKSTGNLAADITISKEWMPSSLLSKPTSYLIPSFGRPFDAPGLQPLAQRGWTLQERILAPRMLHFCPDQMYFECLIGQLAEDGSRIVCHDKKFEHLLATQRLPQEKHGLGSVSGTSFIEGHPPVADETPQTGRWDGGWLVLVKNYTSRKLTVQDDKLPALSGLAHRLASYTYDTYLAGLWKSHLLEDMFWRVQVFEEHRIQVPDGFMHYVGKRLCTPSRPAKYRAPTWSWASLDDAQVKFVPLDYGRLLARLVDAKTVPQGEDRFGRLKSGWLCMRGPLIAVQKAPADYKPHIEEPLGFGVPMVIDTVDGIAYGEGYFDVESESARDRCLAFFLDPANAILLEPVEGSEGTYTRLGTAKFLRTQEQRRENPLMIPGGGLGSVPYGPVTNVDGLKEVIII
ncbi:heterokaryon incompatibility protein-domain-containing protein [Xylariales sp. PMI_506]|nr:heterokaryon incompatibility protein-domain-containing protein [Xylariales sp. PMI_506]